MTRTYKSRTYSKVQKYSLALLANANDLCRACAVAWKMAGDNGTTSGSGTKCNECGITEAVS